MLRREAFRFGGPRYGGCLFTATSWSHLLDDDPGRAPIEWRFAWALLGGVYGDPVPEHEHPELSAAVERTYGLKPLVAGLERAASSPAVGGVDPARFAALADNYMRVMGGCAA